MEKKSDTWHFFATVSRMKYIERWALMRSTRPENISEHSLEVAMIGHALCIIGNVRYGKRLNAEKAALIGLYHDASEIITGDMPTPVKYSSRDIRAAYRKVEEMAENRFWNSCQRTCALFTRKFSGQIRPRRKSIFAAW